ncbi:hypothetical protein FPRO06_06373 [Fusarium proliferatum]|nr:hypothetical protein FPRO06_06373 [Fusarium proliferatum]
MCQFDSSDEPGYIMIKWLLQKWIRELPEHKSAGPVDPTEPPTEANVPALDTPSELHILHGLLGLSKEDTASTSEDSNGRLKPLLSPEIVRWLASKELLSSIQQGRLTISTAPLLESFTISTTNPSSTKGNWYLSEDDKPFLRKVDIPIRLYSAETYEFLGYRRDVADNLWKAFSSSLNPSFSLLEVSKKHLEENPTDLENSKYNWNYFMVKIGICDSLRTSILDTHFENIRSTDSCEFWLRTAFEIRWQELQALNGDLLKVMKRTASTGEQPTGSGSSALSHDHGTNTQQGQSSQHQDTAQSLGEQGSGEKKEKGTVTETTPATRTIEPESEQITLWRGGPKTSIEHANDNGQLRLDMILSAPGDFSGRMLVPYFTPQLKTAEKYGAFHAILSRTGTPPYLLKFQVGRKWLQELPHRCLWARNRGRDMCDIGASGCPDKNVQEKDTEGSWEHVIFTCRRKGPTPKIFKGKDLAIGHIAAFHTEKVQEMKSATEISTGILLIDNIPAVQYVFVTDDAQEQLVMKAKEVETECLRGEILKICRDSCTGEAGIDDVKILKWWDLCPGCKAKLGYESQSGSKKRRASAPP